jgi:uncharacterized ParB-like nuclease family protein
MPTLNTAKPASALHAEQASNIEQLGGPLENSHTPTPDQSQQSLASILQEIRIDAIRHDPELQMRDAGVDVGIVAEYADAMEAGAKFPPIVVYFDGEAYWPADGFHRLDAAKKVGRETIWAEVHDGGKRDALLHAVGVNAFHGLRRTAADRRRAIVAMLRDPQWARWSDREIGKRCAVDHKTVAKVRADLTGDFPTDRTYTTKHGTIATMNTAAIGKRTGDFPTDKPNGSMMGRLLAQVSDDALLAECRRRKLVVCDAH